MNTIISFVLVLGILIFVHELGHFLFAKLFKVKVLKFSLGFGPKIFGKQYGDTEYVVSAFPLGGYVKMVGQGSDEQKVSEEDKDVAFVNKSVIQRFFIVLAGPLFNLLLPVLLFFMVYATVGIPEPVDSTVIGVVTENSPAEQAGIQAGDEILAINGVEVSGWGDVVHLVKESKGSEVSLDLHRNGETFFVQVTPTVQGAKNIFGEEVEKRHMIGIQHEDRIAYTDAGLFEALKAGVLQTWMYIYLTVLSFVKLFQQVIPASELGGPILIAQMAGEQMKAGWINLLYFMSLLSVNLGILNLLPVPVLDGGHLVFLTYEGLVRKPVNERVQIISQQVGIALLVLLMVFVFYNDIARIFS